MLIRTIAIDAGHGLRDPGKTVGNIRESNITYEISQYLYNELAAAGCVPALLRGAHEDPSMYLRNKRASEAGANLVLCLHCNSAQASGAHGLIAFYWPGNKQTQEIARLIQSGAPAELRRPGLPSPALRANYPRVRNVIGAYDPPVVLLECGFMSNAIDLQLLVDPAMQRRIAKSIASAVSAYREVV